MASPDSSFDKQTLLQAAQGGSRPALGQLLEIYRPYLLQLAREAVFLAWAGCAVIGNFLGLRAHRARRGRST